MILLCTVPPELVNVAVKGLEAVLTELCSSGDDPYTIRVKNNSEIWLLRGKWIDPYTASFDDADFTD